MKKFVLALVLLTLCVSDACACGGLFARFRQRRANRRTQSVYTQQTTTTTTNRTTAAGMQFYAVPAASACANGRCGLPSSRLMLVPVPVPPAIPVK